MRIQLYIYVYIIVQLYSCTVIVIYIYIYIYMYIYFCTHIPCLHEDVPRREQRRALPAVALGAVDAALSGGR